MTQRFAHAIHPRVQLGTPLTMNDEGKVNGREAADYELEILARARAAALAAETNALFSGLVDNAKFNTDNGA